MQEASKQTGDKEVVIDVGFTYYFILTRFFDIDKKLSKEGNPVHSLQTIV